MREIKNNILRGFEIGLLALCLTVPTVQSLMAQTGCTGLTPGNEIACGDPAYPCCTVYNACNGPYSGCQSYDLDFSGDSGCNLACTPIDSGVLFLLLGGAAFGGMMIVRRKRESLQIV